MAGFQVLMSGWFWAPADTPKERDTGLKVKLMADEAAFYGPKIDFDVMTSGA